MTQNTDTPNLTIPPLPEQLKIRFEDALSRYGETDDESLMAEHVQILDRAFRCVIMRAVGAEANIQAVVAALKAQNQCRQTMNSSTRLEKITAEKYRTR